MTAPNTRLIAKQSLEDRLFANRVVADQGCWEWTASLNEHGYGRMSYQNHVYRVHRLAAHLWMGLDLADNAVKVCHHCDNPKCFNPDHLYLGDQKTNVRDMVSRGRNYPGPARWTHCSKGHELTAENRTRHKNPRCRTCNNEYQNHRRAGKRTVRAIESALEANRGSE